MFELTTIGAISDVRPRIRPVLTILEPIVLPKTKSVLPSIDATIDTTISGIEVPKPTITMPINRGGKLACCAVEEAPTTKRLALHTNIHKPKNMAENAVNIFAPNRC
jgi:hypothetical protein